MEALKHTRRRRRRPIPGADSGVRRKACLNQELRRAAAAPRSSRRVALALRLRCAALAALAGLSLGTGCCLGGRSGPGSAAIATCREHSQKALGQMDRGRWTDAEENLARAVKICPVDAEARGHYADVLWRQGKTSEAAAELKQAVELIPNDVALRLKLAEVSLALGDTTTAMQQVDQAIDRDAHSRQGWFLRGQVNERIGRSQQALADYHRALRYDPAQTPVLLRIAAVHAQQGQHERALLVLHDAEERFSPGSEPAELMFHEALAYKALGRIPDAVDALNRACAREPKFVEAHYLLADIEFRRGRITEATAALQPALAAAPQHPACQSLWNQIQVASQPIAARPF